MVKKLLSDEYVSKSFLIKTVISMLGIIAAMILLSFKIGGMFVDYTELAKIPVSDIQKAVQYSVYDQQKRKDEYRMYMSANDLRNNTQDKDILSLKEFKYDMKQDIKDIKFTQIKILERLK